MATKTIRHLVEDVLLSKLRVLAAGEASTQEDYNLVSEKYSDVYSELADEGVAYWPEDEIPATVFDRLSSYVAHRTSVAFGLPRDIQSEVYHLRQLRKHNSRSASGLPVPGIYF